MDETVAISPTLYRRLSERLRDLGATRWFDRGARTRFLGVADCCDQTAEHLERHATQPSARGLRPYNYDPYA